MLNKKYLLIAAGVLVVLFIAVSLSADTSTKKTQTPASDFIAVDAPASLTNSEELYVSLGAVRFDLLRNDLTKYARDFKKSTDRNITYSVDNVSSKDDSVTFKATYVGTSPFKVSVEISKLPNERAKISITDSDSKDASFNTNLSANNKRNTYIATLPITADSYTIDYDPSSDLFVVSLSERSPEARDAAETAITSAVGIEEKDKITYLVPGTGDTFN